MSMLFVSSELLLITKSTSRLGLGFVVECYGHGFFVNRSLKTSSDRECQLMEKGLEPSWRQKDSPSEAILGMWHLGCH